MYLNEIRIFFQSISLRYEGVNKIFHPTYPSMIILETFNIENSPYFIISLI